MRKLPFLTLALLAPGVALATNVTGTLPSNTTWNLAGSPYYLLGDVTVPSGVTLTLQAGVQIIAATSDAQGSGASASHVELIIQGTALSEGSSASPVELTTSGTSGAWYGVRVLAGGTANLAFTNVSRAVYGVSVEASTANLTWSGGGASSCSTLGLHVTGGTANVDHVVLTANLSGASYTGSGAGTLHHNTVVNNNDYGLYISTSGTVTARDSIFTGNSYGIYKPSGGTTPSLSYNDAWGNIWGNLYGVSGGTGNFSANPLFVGASDFHLTSSSPARLSASDGTDLGALAYAGAVTPSLQGTLHEDTTLTGANTLAGDLTVPAGITLTLAPGATLTASTSDGMQSGVDTARVELIVQGTVLSQGTSASPVALTSSGASDAWYGLRVLAGGTANLAFTNVSKAIYGVSVPDSTATLTWSGGTASGCSILGLHVTGGTANVDHVVLTANLSGASYTGSGAGTFHHNTVINNINYGLYISTSGAVTARDSIFTGNSYGIYYSTGTTPSLSYNDAWSNSTSNVFGASAGTGSFSSNPLLVSASDFNLTSRSPARRSASNGTDMGALAYAGAITPSLQGTLHEDTTLTGANTVAGDLTVAPGVTLTLAPGATLTAITGDGMQSGADLWKVELIIQGTVLSQGTSASPVELTSSGARGAWRGVRVTAAGTANLTFTNVSKALYGIWVDSSTANLTWSGGGASDCSGSGLHVTGGTANVDHLIFNANANGAGYSNSGAGTFHHNTVVNNNGTGLYVNTSGALTVRDSIFTGGSHGIQRNSGTPSLSHNNAWGNSLGDLSNISSPGTGSFSANPLFVSASDFNLTSLSPARLAASDGSDIGALAYAGAVTPNLEGTLRVDTTLTGANTLVGDLTVPAGVTLTLAPGATLTAAASDDMRSGADTARVELIIQGTVLSQGTSASPVELTTSGTSGAWYGVRVLAGGTANFAFTHVSKAFNGASVLASTANLTWSGGGASSCSNFGLYVYSGTANVDHLIFNANKAGVCYTSFGAGTFHHNTVVNNTIYGMYTATSGVVTARDSIFAGNSYGIYRDVATAPSLSYNDVWGNSAANYYGVSAGTGSFSSNPLFVSASDFNLTSRSPARLAASDGTDVGALAYAGAITPNLQGTLDVDTTLTGANTLAGDLTVPAGITLTLAPGATLNVATNDGMQSGADTARVELIIQGAVLSQGTSASPVTLITSGTSGAWYGIRVLAGGTANLAFTHVSKAVNGVSVEASTANLTWSGGGASSCSTAGLNVTGGTANVDHVVLNANAIGAHYAGNGAGTFHHNTVVNNTAEGLRTSTTGAVTARDSIFTGGSYGIYFSSGTLPSLSYNDTWGNTTNLSGVSAGTGSFSTNPLYVSTSDFHLQATSPCRNRGSDGSDIGAYPYAPFVDHIVITPSNPSVVAGGTQAFTAQAYDASNNPMAVTFTWSALPAAGTIGASGVLSASCGAGTVVNGVTATAPNGVSASATVTITPGAVTQITLSPAGAIVPAGGSQTFAATPRDSCGNAISTPVTWSAAAGSITSQGVYTAPCAPGAYPTAVTANVGSISASADVTVTLGPVADILLSPPLVNVPAGGMQSFTAIPLDSCANPLGTAVVWSTAPGTGSVDASGNYIAPCTPGSYAAAVRATAGSITRTADVIVGTGAVSQILVSPASATVSAGGAQAFTATPKDACGNTVSAPITWSTAPGAGSITSVGAYTATCTPGSYPAAVHASSGAISGTASVTVTPGALASLSITPANPSIPVAATQAFSASGADSCGNSVPATVSWSVAAGGGTIDATSGVFTADGTLGSFTNTVQATSGTITARTDVTVVPGSIHHITVTPASPTVPAGSSVAFSAQAYDSADNPITGITFTWSVAPGAGTIDGSGNYTAPCTPGSYPAAVHASSGAISGTASVTVTPGALASLSITPANPSIPVGAIQAFSASGADTCGNSVPATVSWSVVAGGGSINAISGVFTAGTTIGTFANTVQATSGAVTARTSVTVTRGAIHHIVVTPANPSVTVGDSVSFSAQAYDAGNDPIDNVTFTWNALPAAGTISAAGVLTASCSPGTVNNAVTASAEGVSGSASVTLTIGALARIEVSPGSTTVAAGASRVFTATPRDSCGNTVTAPVTWSVASGAGTIDGSGNYTAPCTPGSYTGAVIATSGTTTGSADVTVTTGTLARVTIHPSNSTLPAGGSQTFTASTTDSCGNAVGGSITWSVAAGGGTIAPTTGVFTAGGVLGTFPDTVRANAGGQVASTNVTIIAGPVATVAMVPTSATLTPGAKTTFTATAQDAFGNPVTAAATWSVVNGGGTIDAVTGELTAGSVAGTFNDTVLANVSGKSATASVIIIPGSASRVAVSPTSAAVAPGGTTSFSAQVFDAFDNLRSDTVTWSMSDPLAGSISSSGVLTAGTVVGSYPGAVVAHAGRASGTARVTINANALARLELSPSTVTVQARGAVTFTVKGLDAYNNTVQVTPTWAVLNGGGTIDAQGVFTAGTRSGTFTNTLQVQAGGLAATATVVVTPGRLASITLSPNHPTLAPGQTEQFTALGKDLDGNEVSGLSFTWSADPTAGTIDSNGLFTAGSTSGDHLDAVRVTAGEVTTATSVLITSGEADGGMDCPQPQGGGFSCSGGGNVLAAALGLLTLVLLPRRERMRRSTRCQ